MTLDDLDMKILQYLSVEIALTNNWLVPAMSRETPYIEE